MVSPEISCQTLTMRMDKLRPRLLRSVAVEPSDSSLGARDELNETCVSSSNHLSSSDIGALPLCSLASSLFSSSCDSC